MYSEQASMYPNALHLTPLPLVSPTAQIPSLLLPPPVAGLAAICGSDKLAIDYYPLLRAPLDAQLQAARLL